MYISKKEWDNKCLDCGLSEDFVHFQQYAKICNKCKSIRYNQKNPDYFRNYMKKYMKDKYIPVTEPKKRGRKPKEII